MEKINHATAVGGLFTEGDPLTGTPATVVTADWLNNLQEEICNVIEDAGITLDGEDQTQLLAAISTMITSVSPEPQYQMELISTRTTTGAWVITDVIVGRPLVIGVTEGDARWQVVSGTALGVISGTETWGFFDSSNIGSQSVPSCVLVPNDTSIEINVVSLVDAGVAGPAILHAYQ